MNLFKRNLKNKKGFSLVELMVVVAIMGTLAAIAIPAYNEYRKSSKKSAYKADLSSLHKGWLAFGVEIDSFCERRTEPRGSNLKNVGMESLKSSKLYGTSPAKANFIGFSKTASDCLVDHDEDTATPLAAVTTGAGIPSGEGINVADVAGSKDDHCELGVDSYKMGVYGHISGENWYAVQIENTGVINERAEANQATVLPTTCS